MEIRAISSNVARTARKVPANPLASLLVAEAWKTDKNVMVPALAPAHPEPLRKADPMSGWGQRGQNREKPKGEKTPRNGASSWANGQ